MPENDDTRASDEELAARRMTEIPIGGMTPEKARELYELAYGPCEDPAT